MEDETEATSHKGKKVHSYTIQFKSDAIRYAENKGNHAAERKFNVDRKRIREWRDNKGKIEELLAKTKGTKRKRCDGGGRKPFNEQLEEMVLEWVYDRRYKGLRVSRKLIMKKAKVMYDEMIKNEPTHDEENEFLASTGWLKRFMQRNGLSLRRKTSIAQKDPDKLIDKLVSFVLQVRRLSLKYNYQAADIIAMDETPVWADMVSETTVDVTGTKTVTVKTSGHEKSRVSVCLTAKADGTKLKPMIVFKGAKREVDSLNKEFKNCIIASSANAWMNTELTNVWVNQVLGSFSFRRRHLIWDSYDCHTEGSVKASLHAKKIDTTIVPGGCTKYIQAPDVCWNKPFKAIATEMYDQWLAEEGINQETAAGNLKPPPRRTIINWILDSWNKLSPDMIKQSFQSCGLNLPNDGSKDNEIHCFKEKQPCEKGREILASQLSILTEKDENPFMAAFIDENDVNDAAPSFSLIDSDHEEDELVDVM